MLIGALTALYIITGAIWCAVLLYALSKSGGIHGPGPALGVLVFAAIWPVGVLVVIILSLIQLGDADEVRDAD